MVSLLTIRTLLEDQIDSGVTTSGTDPSSTLLNLYINESLKEIAVELRPRELRSATASTANITSGQNTATFPSGLLVPESVWLADSNSKYWEVRHKRLKDLIDIVGSTAFFDTNNTGVPRYYDIRGGSFIFDRYFDYTVSSGIKVFGVSRPTSLSADVDETELPAEYTLLIVYKAAVLFYQKDDDVANQQKFQALAFDKASKLATGLDTNDADSITLDPYTFGTYDSNAFSDPGVLFGT